ncbi:MAG: NERD domain-containing protein, partial [Acidimicrobiales bacterium]|nr:NERD domain-containing protein [Acidimicrobiales bacterium]
MEPNSKRWTTVSDSAFDHEREALAWLRRELKDQDPNRGWSNFEFASRNGSLYEVDALVLTAAGLFLVEVKSHPGEISGDGGTWQWAPPNRGRLQTFDNPRLLANRKAKHLADLLGRTGAWRAYRHAHPAARAPYVQEAVFLSDPDLRITLSPPGRFQVFGRDAAPGEELPAARRSIGGIVASLTSLEPDRNGRPARRIDRPMGEAIAKAVAELGIRERTSRKRVGDYRLGELLDDVEADRDTGVTYQDFTATHVSLPDVRRRIRIYPVEHNPTADQRETADRAARREFTLLHALDYPGILRPVEFTESERGPALMFDYDPDERPLHRWLADPAVAERLTVEGRLAVIRMIAEAVRYAHQRGVTHRALCPSAVLVRGDLDDVRIRVTNWHAGARIAYGSGTGAGATSSLATVHGEALARHDAALYRAPEADQPAARAVLLDVFSLGALACLVLTGQPPAETPTGLVRMLVQHGHIPADVIDDELDPGLAGVVADATAADPAGRLPDVTEFLGYLDIAEEEWNLADMPAVSEPAPDDARRGDTLGNGRFTVQHRLGSGSTAIALEVDDNVTGRTAVLKVALDPQHNERLRTEGRALQELRHQAIVELHDGPIEIDGLVALVLSHAGRNTLAARVAEPPGAELAERFGDDLLDAVRYLEQMGVSHRDIKPENIGVAPRGKNDELHLVLFDFSLADAPLDRIEAGTAGYVDPFLKLPGRGAWDLHAERYAAAVTLYELVTGTRPRYGNDGADPAMTTAGPTIDRAAFDPAIANGLTGFFTRALARNIADRFDTADEMLQAWRRAFAAAAQPATPTVHPEPAAGPGDASPGDAGDVPARLVLPAGVTATTPLMSLPLSNRAVNALERQEV